jgi:DNA-binding NarL/FixJ family response regulator
MTHPITIIIADKHELFRDGLLLMTKKVSGMKVIAEAKNGKELLKEVDQHEPDIVLTEIKMNEIDGVTATRMLRKSKPAIGIIALTMCDEESCITAMLEAGANGYILKTASKAEIIEGIKTVYNGKPYYCREITSKLAQVIANHNLKLYNQKKAPSFSERELRIIELICQQKTNKQIAQELFISPRTLETWRLTIEQKMAVRSVVGLVMYAIKKGIYKPEIDKYSIEKFLFTNSSRASH